MGGEFNCEPGDRPDPERPYFCDPVERVCTLLKLLLGFTAFKVVLVIAAYVMWIMGVL